ncbi:MAG: hypothetical protein HUJ98_08060 [Bacteroidaceae bacterium]|nr:hypothetical protein [Bacteroidaceae bacterium]
MDIIGKSFEFIQRTLGVNIVLKDEKMDRKGLSSGLAMSFSLHLVAVEGIEFVMLVPKQELALTGGTYAKRVAAIQDTLKLPAILVLKELSTDARRTLIGNLINFVVPEKQLYLPRLAMYFTQRGVDTIKKDSEKFAPATQAVLFYHLIHPSLDGKMLKEIASNVSYGMKAVGVAISEIAKAGLCEIKQPDKRTKVVHFPLARKEIWEKAQPYLSSPIANVYYVESKDVLPSDSFCYSYDSATARCTMMSQPSQETIAIEKNSLKLKELLGTGSFSMEEGPVRLEAWKYSPLLLADNGVADPLSLWMCYRAEDDERIDGELGRLIDKRLSE